MESVTVILLIAPDTGESCSIDLVLNVGTTTSSGSLPPVMPARSAAAPDNVVIATLAIEPMLLLPSVSAASTLTARDVCALVGLPSSNVIVQSVLPARVVAAVSFRVPESLFQSPVVPSLSLQVVTAKLFAVAVVDPVSPEIVTVASDDPAVSS